ncbi:MAG: hypothetical protein ABIM30_06005 [candidate division WOR-3 bacterium]
MGLWELSLISMLVLFIGFSIGWFMDPLKRARVFRVLTKSDWGCLGIVSPDTKSIRFVVVNLGRDVVVHKGKIWIVLKDRVYRHDKPERGLSLSKPDLPVKWVEGVPVIYVNETSYEPIDIVGKIGEVRPDEVNAIFSSWISNQLAKAMAKILSTFKNIQTILLICAVFAVAAGVFAYLTWQIASESKAILEQQQDMVKKTCLKTGACIFEQEGELNAR